MVTVGAPARGPADAPVTIVEFSDFHSPFCLPGAAGAGSGAGEVRRQDAGWSSATLPIDTLHPQARAAAEAARCATEQGKFWEFHDLVLKNDADALPATLDGFGEDGRAQACGLRSLPHLRQVQEPGPDEQRGRRPGSASPARRRSSSTAGILVGAQPFEAFARIIDEELALGRPGR